MLELNTTTRYKPAHVAVLVITTKGTIELR